MAVEGITDDGVVTAANIARLAAVATAVINTVAAVEMASKQAKLAKNYLKISQEQNQYYYDVFVPCENKELEEACNASKYNMHVSVQVGRYKNSVRVGYQGKVSEVVVCNNRYNTGRKAALIQDTLMAEAQALTAAANMGRRYEEQYADAKDDLRWSRRSAALNRGRGIMAQAVTFAGFAYGLFGRLGDQAAKGAAGAIGYLGYESARNDTSYPSKSVPKPYMDIEPIQLGTSYPVPDYPSNLESGTNIPSPRPSRAPVIRG